MSTAEQGHAEAQFHLGLLYAAGRCEFRDDAQAVEWLLRAAEQGHAEAQFHLGLLYAEQWLLRAAEQGHAEAQFHLGLLSGRGVLRRGNGNGINGSLTPERAPRPTSIAGWSAGPGGRALRDRYNGDRRVLPGTCPPATGGTAAVILRSRGRSAWRTRRPTPPPALLDGSHGHHPCKLGVARRAARGWPLHPHRCTATSATTISTVDRATTRSLEERVTTGSKAERVTIRSGAVPATTRSILASHCIAPDRLRTDDFWVLRSGRSLSSCPRIVARHCACRSCLSGHGV